MPARRVIAIIAGVVVALGLIAAKQWTDSSSATPAGPLSCQQCGTSAASLGVLANQPVIWGDVDLDNSDGQPAVIDRVRPLGAPRDLELLGVRAATRRTLIKVGFVSIATGNPAWLALTRPAEGFAVAPGGKNLDEVQLSIFFRRASPGTYTVRNVAVDYHVGDRHYTVLTGHAVTFCAVRSQPSKVNCPSPPAPKLQT